MPLVYVVARRGLFRHDCGPLVACALEERRRLVTDRNVSRVTDTRPANPELPRAASAKAVYLMVFFSGFAGLVYQVLWMRQLGFLFGNTSHAAAATLSAFFAGLAAGSRFWGRRSGGATNPLRIYAYLQAGIAVTALLYFAVLGVSYLVYPPVYRAVGPGALLVTVKFLLALLLVLPPSFCMGGTIPVIGQYLIRRQDSFGTTSALLYGVNILGGGLGAFLTGFFFVYLLGARATCLLAMAMSGMVAAAAFRMSRRAGVAKDRAESDYARRQQKRDRKRKEKEAAKSGSAADRWAVRSVCFLSGFCVLALEVLWTRMFAQIHENSVYSFSSVVVIVLVGLALGALIASRLARLDIPPMRVLAALTVGSGIILVLSPWFFVFVTNGMQAIAVQRSFLSYVLVVFLEGSATVGVVAVVFGTVFPFLMKAEEKYAFLPGDSLGRLSAVNTAGAILGSLLCGFVFLGAFGMWRTTQLIAAAYLAAGILLPTAWDKGDKIVKASAGMSLLLLFTFLSPAGLPVTGRPADPDEVAGVPARPEERVLKTWEASDCTVTAAENERRDVFIKINSHYSLGSAGARDHQVLQARVPLLVYPRTRSIFFLGMGTGITAGAALSPEFKELKRVVVCELVPEVITAAKEYMTDFRGADPRGEDLTNGLFDDDRVEILVEDGRHYLMATSEKFDMINADLFLPYRNGASSLYSREHFLSVHERLNPGGVFVQWLPLFQITEDEFGIIANTMLEVFDQVTMWRETFHPGAETVALVGHRDPAPLPPSTIDASAKKIAAVRYRTCDSLIEFLYHLDLDPQTIMLFYCGNLTAAKELFEGRPVNTDDRPLVEYMTPRSLRRADQLTPKFVGPKIARLVDEMQAICPPEVDPMLMNRTAENRRLPAAGAALHRAWVEMVVTRDRTRCLRAWDEFVGEWTNRPSDR